jgi:hypothetical protein
MVHSGDTECGQAVRPSVSNTRRPFSIGADDLTWLAVAVGVLLRVLEFVQNRGLYQDELALLRNLVSLPVFDLHTTLSDDQLAPPFYLIVGRLIVRLPWLTSGWSARLLSLSCGVLSMFLMRTVARRYLMRQAVPLAVGLFALADWLLYYSSEIKQYYCDATLALVALWLAAAPAAAWSPRALSATRRDQVLLAAFGAVGVWFSFPLAFVLTGIATYLIAAPAWRRQWRCALGYLAMSLVWAVSCAGCVKVSQAILSPREFIWHWWGFAFLPLPPRSLADLQHVFWQVVNVFNSPADVVTPLGVLPSAFIALALFLVGSVALARSWFGACWLLVSPFFFGLAASAMHRYPFHGRLLLYLVPSIHLLVAEGAVVLARRGRSLALLAVGGFLLYQPAADVVWHHMIIHRARGFDTHGDMRPDLLDFLDSLKSTGRRL